MRKSIATATAVILGTFGVATAVGEFQHGEQGARPTGKYQLLDTSTQQFYVDSHPMHLSASRTPYSFTTPSARLYRFEVRHNDYGWRGDERNGTRRSELVSSGVRFKAGETLWTSFSFIVPADQASFHADSGGDGYSLIHQWHSVDGDDGPRGPVFGVELTGGNLNIITRSDRGGPGVKVTHFSMHRPIDGVPHHIVASGALGKDGHLTVWLDGTVVVDGATPIGYYRDDGGDRALAYPHWGIYEKNIREPAVVYHANIEFGIGDLSSRITRPIHVEKPAGGWT
ncbi:heparin lyase I family protein [Mycolicibacterium sp. PDY-3]|uniref:heparin lyase I family protein n=1 Tax=Mycolicibacterium sp. PDY-3 TaxID=3376069 RepID=UPI003790C306